MLKWVMVAWACCVSCAMGAGPTAQEVIEKSRAVYAEMDTYRSEGTVTVLLEGAKGKQEVKTEFTLLLKRPDRYRITWSQTIPGGAMPPMLGAVWNAGAGPHLFMGIANAYSPLTGDRQALAAATGISSGVAAGVPTMLLDALVEHPTPIDPFRDPVLEGVENVGDEPCHVISGSTAFYKAKLWISTESFLLLKWQRFFDMDDTPLPQVTDDEIVAAAKELGMADTPENRDRIRRVIARTKALMKENPTDGSFTEVHTGIGSPELTDADFAFEVPEGTERKDNLLDAMPNIGEE